MPVRITVPEAPSEADRAAVFTPLLAFNTKQSVDPRYRPVAILLTGEDGSTVGGLWGRINYDWLFVELLAVPEVYRGRDLGSGLMWEAERIARASGCLGLWLDTYAFQARGFYEKLGFRVFGTLEDNPVGQQHFFMCKRFE